MLDDIYMHGPDVPDFIPPYGLREFEKIRVQFCESVVLHNPDLRIDENYIFKRLEYAMRAYIWANPKHASIEYPMDWWQWFKDRWFPKWAKRRWPIKMHRVDIREIFPFLSIDTPEYESRLLQVWSTHEKV